MTRGGEDRGGRSLFPFESGLGERVLARTGTGDAAKRTRDAGGTLSRARERAKREATLRRFAPVSRWVLARVQAALAMPAQSREGCSENRCGRFAPSTSSLRRAVADISQDAPGP